MSRQSPPAPGDGLAAELRAGSVVVTVNRRLARQLLATDHALQRAAGAGAWLRPQILSLNAWLTSQAALLDPPPLVLTPAQAAHLWEFLLSEDLAGESGDLLQVPQTARRAFEAHQLLVRYGAEFAAADGAEDHRAFLRWRQSWLKRTQPRGWCVAAELPRLLAAALRAGTLAPPARMLWAGFDELSPDLSLLRDALAARGCRVDDWEPEARDGRRMRLRASDPVEEVRRCARWVRALLASDPQTRIAVVVPQLERYQALIEREFSAELDPAGCLHPGAEERTAFNLSLGNPLDHEGPVHAALQLLALREPLSLDEAGSLLGSPYLAGAETEAAPRALADRMLRELGRVSWSSASLQRALREAGVPGFAAILHQLQVLGRERRPRLPGDWAELFSRFLHACGWPGERPLSSREYQAVQHLRELLGGLASLDAVSGRTDRHAAGAVLHRLASNALFQPEGGGEQVQVMGILEAAGLSCDHLWLMGMHDQALPRPPAPNPFLPLPLQRRLGMPHADAARERLFAERLARRLLRAAPDLVVSWPALVEGAQYGPSPLFLEIEVGSPPAADPVSPARVLWQTRPQLDLQNDLQAPPLQPRKPVSGGTRLLKDQAICPFRAFAHHRLRAAALETPEIGIDGRGRGALVHTLLEWFWRETGSRAAFLRLSEPELGARLAACAEMALVRFEKSLRRDLPPRQRGLERQRLIQLGREWLRLEAQRDDFSVSECEREHEEGVGRLRIRTRIDRIDRLADGTLAIIDYKTGRPDVAQWLTPRVTEPQLPLYALSLPPAAVGAVMIARVSLPRREAGFRGLARRPEAWSPGQGRAQARLLEAGGWSGLDPVIEHWRTALARLGDDFLEGRAAVDPLDPPRSCRDCDLQPLCRIFETVAPEGEETLDA